MGIWHWRVSKLEITECRSARERRSTVDPAFHPRAGDVYKPREDDGVPQLLHIEEESRLHVPNSRRRIWTEGQSPFEHARVDNRLPTHQHPGDSHADQSLIVESSRAERGGRGLQVRRRFALLE